MAKVLGPQPLSHALAELVALRGLARVGGNAQLELAWSEVAGEKLAVQTKVLGIKNGVLQIGVSNAPLLAELTSFHKSFLLQALQEQYTGVRVRDLRFRLKSDIAAAQRIRIGGKGLPKEDY